jgi:hypothetical protein
VFGSEEGRGKGLGEGLNKCEEGNGREDDKGEIPGTGKGEYEACDAGCEVLEEHTKGQGGCGPVSLND